MNNNLKINELSVFFQSREKSLIAVDSVNLTLKPGETLALLGESGCGKSITALALMRLLPHNAAYGYRSEVDFNGQDLLNLPESLMRTLRGHRVAIVFPEPMTALNPVLTIGAQLREALPNALQGKGVEARLIAMLQEVEIPNPALRLTQYPHQLSGGQKQRVVIAMALASKPEILIADEPTTALDVTTQAQILQLLKKLKQQYRMSLLLITHDLTVVKAIADRVCVMYAGQIVEEALVNPFFEEVLHPYSQQLLASVPHFTKRSQRLHAIEGAVPRLDDLPTGCRFHPRCLYAFSRCNQEMPQLAALQARAIRCHLYPEQNRLPLLEETEARMDIETKKSEMVLTVRSLTVNYSTQRQLFQRNVEHINAVEGLSFTLAKGKTLALVGESGCGKTTASRAILRLQPIASGEVLYRGQSVIGLSGRALRNYRKKVQIIFQDPFSSLNPRMTIGDILAEGMHAQGFSKRFIARKQQILLEQVNLPRNSLHRYPHQFSGGQRQRISIARALATEPEMLICDEPTSALDVSVQAQILNLLKDLQQESGLAYLFITHNLAVVSYMADEILIMRQGRGIEFGTCERVLSAPREEYTKTLLASIMSL
ncbi:MAG: dipeptide ABC transporter ATP-binding protein [Tatlockia sp.]